MTTRAESMVALASPLDRHSILIFRYSFRVEFLLALSRLHIPLLAID